METQRMSKNRGTARMRTWTCPAKTTGRKSLAGLEIDKVMRIKYN